MQNLRTSFLIDPYNRSYSSYRFLKSIRNNESINEKSYRKKLQLKIILDVYLKGTMTIAHRMVFEVYRMTLNLPRIFHEISNRGIERFLSNRQRRRQRRRCRGRSRNR